MKKYIYTIAYFLVILSSNAQQVEDKLSNRWYGKKDVYYEDFDNNYDAFEGVYSCTNDSISFDLALKKIKKSYSNKFFYQDIMVGELRFVKNGVERINTIDKLHVEYRDDTEQRYHTIHGGAIIKGNNRCFECAVNEKSLAISCYDTPAKRGVELFIRKTNVNGVAALNVFVYSQEITLYSRRVGQPPVVRGKRPIDVGSYLLTKIYFNSPIVKQISRNCPAETTPYSVQYEVPFGKYRSTVSQLDADNKALADIDANGQNYANSHGICK